MTWFLLKLLFYATHNRASLSLVFRSSWFRSKLHVALSSLRLNMMSSAATATNTHVSKGETAQIYTPHNLCRTRAFCHTLTSPLSLPV